MYYNRRKKEFVQNPKRYTPGGKRNQTSNQYCHLPECDRALISFAVGRYIYWDCAHLICESKWKNVTSAALESQRKTISFAVLVKRMPFHVGACTLVCNSSYIYLLPNHRKKKYSAITLREEAINLDIHEKFGSEMAQISTILSSCHCHRANFFLL